METKAYYITRNGRDVEISSSILTLSIYRIPFQNLIAGTVPSFEIKNKFIVYILLKKNNSGIDSIYVGKSKIGLERRPTAHGDDWTHCYILTQPEGQKLFCDSTIQYIEGAIIKRVKELKQNFALQNIVNHRNMPINCHQERDCNTYLKEAYEMLDVLGLDLIPDSNSENDDTKEKEATNISKRTHKSIPKKIIPDGIYTMSRPIRRWKYQRVIAKMQIIGEKCILLKGSIFCPIKSDSIEDATKRRRSKAKVSKDNILQEDFELDTCDPSAASAFLIGGPTNGWQDWKTEEGEPIDCFRNHGEN